MEEVDFNGLSCVAFPSQLCCCVFDCVIRILIIYEFLNFAPKSIYPDYSIVT